MKRDTRVGDCELPQLFQARSRLTEDDVHRAVRSGGQHGFDGRRGHPANIHRPERDEDAAGRLRLCPALERGGTLARELRPQQRILGPGEDLRLSGDERCIIRSRPPERLVEQDVAIVRAVGEVVDDEDAAAVRADRRLPRSAEEIMVDDDPADTVASRADERSRVAELRVVVERRFVPVGALAAEARFRGNARDPVPRAPDPARKRLRHRRGDEGDRRSTLCKRISKRQAPHDVPAPDQWPGVDPDGHLPTLSAWPFHLAHRLFACADE